MSVQNRPAIPPFVATRKNNSPVLALAAARVLELEPRRFLGLQAPILDFVLVEVVRELRELRVHFEAAGRAAYPPVGKGGATATEAAAAR